MLKRYMWLMAPELVQRENIPLSPQKVLQDSPSLEFRTYLVWGREESATTFIFPLNEHQHLRLLQPKYVCILLVQFRKLAYHTKDHG